MSDPNGDEAGVAFLAKNKDAEGVITLPSGLQYKVLEEGAGLEHPTVSTPCECHYAGRLLDGNEFDSSYKRGTPTTFAPNQVIKGWTEAMQLMVQGDKWEMYAIRHTRTHQRPILQERTCCPDDALWHPCTHYYMALTWSTPFAPWWQVHPVEPRVRCRRQATEDPGKGVPDLRDGDYEDQGRDDGKGGELPRVDRR